jgi:hypothetical protein
MKKVTYAFLVCIGVLLIGQPKAQAQVNFGIRGSINIANVRDASFDTESITGYAFGGYARFTIPNTPFDFQPEILFSQKGFETTSGLEDPDLNTAQTFTLDYIEIPLLIKLNLGRSRRVAPYIYGGTYLGVNIGSSAKTGELEVDVQEFDETDYGFTVGAGLNISLLNIEARYEGGLTEISENSDARNGVLTLTAAIEF